MFPGGEPIEGKWSVGASGQVEIVAGGQAQDAVRLICWEENGSLVVEKRVRTIFAREGAAAGAAVTAARKRMKCAANVGEFVKAALLFATDHEELLPASLAALSNYVSDATILRRRPLFPGCLWREGGVRSTPLRPFRRC